jgi:hypothetical protein
VPETRFLPHLIAAAAGAVYLGTACPHVLGGDNGEFATLLETGGVAHPPGFPLYVLILRLFRFIPASSPAHAAALLTAVLASLSVLALACACLAWGASAGATAIASAAYASSSVAWKLGTHAEIFAPSALVGALIVAVSAPSGRFRGWRRAGLLGVLAGGALSTHPALVLLAPVGLWALRAAVKEAPRGLSCFVAALAGTCFGLLPYAHLLFVARHADPQASWVWGNVHDLRSLVAHFLRSEYGTLRLSLSEKPQQPTTHVPRMSGALARELLGLPVLVAGTGLAWALVAARRRATSPEWRAAILSLVLAFTACGPVFAARFNRSLTDNGSLIVERFYLLPMVPLAVLCALALDATIPRIAGGAMSMVIAPLTFVAGLSLSFERVREYSRPTLQLYVENVLAFVPARTVILGVGDDKFSGFLYALRALRARPDVTFLAPQLLFAPWYREEESARLGIALSPPDGHHLRVAEIVTQLLRAGHPVAFAGFVAEGLDRTFATYPLGPLVFASTPAEPAPPPDALERMNLEVTSGFRLEPSPPARGDGWAGALQEDYAIPWRSLAAAFETGGQPERARACLARAAAISPPSDGEISGTARP